MDLLAGTKVAGEGALSDSHTQMIQDMTRVFEAQRLVSLDTILTLADRLEAAAAGQKLDNATVVRLAGRITEIQLPRTALTTRDRTEASVGYWTDKHIDGERKLNLRSAIDKAGADPQKLRDIRGALAPVLRDTLVGFNYVHYAPPGAQVLFTNPSFVRSHDFYGSPDHQRTWLATLDPMQVSGLKVQWKDGSTAELERSPMPDLWLLKTKDCAWPVSGKAHYRCGVRA